MKMIKPEGRYLPPVCFSVALQSSGDILDTSSRIEDISEFEIDYDENN